jgi:hypothetical protein
MDWPRRKNSTSKSIATQDIVYKGALAATLPPEVEHRANIRYACVATANVVEPKSGARVSGRVTDLGLGGFYMDTMSVLPVGTTVKVRIDLANRSFESAAKVVFALSGMGMGLAFAETPEKDQAILQSWVRQMSEGMVPSWEATEPPVDKRALEREREFSRKLVSLLVQKGILTEAEAYALLDLLFR